MRADRFHLLLTVACGVLGITADLCELGAETQPAIKSMSRGESRNIFGYDPTADFIAFDLTYPEKHRKYARELRDLQLELARQTAQGRPTPCSRQIFLEARWLTF